MKRTFLLLTCVVFLAACNLQSKNVVGPMSWIDAPLTGSTVPLNSPVQVISHSSAPADLTAVELSVNNSVISTDPVSAAGQSYVLMKQNWTPTNAGVYQLRVRAQSSDGQWSNYAIVQVNVAREAVSTASPTPVPTAVASTTPTVLLAPSFTLTENANCRMGPNPVFQSVGILAAGSSVDILGKLSDSSWYFVSSKPLNTKCWVSSQTGQAAGDLSGVAVLVAPPTPLPAFQAPILNGNQFFNNTGCGSPESVTISFPVANATGVTLYYQVTGSGWFSIPMTLGGGHWNATIQSGGSVSPYTGTLSYYAVASNGAASVTSPTYSDVTVTNCKP